jgi:hypothetical protein
MVWRTGIGCCLLVLFFAGCESRPETPEARIQSLFHHAQFPEAIEVIEGELPKAADAAQTAHLLMMKGRCYWEMSARQDEETRQNELLNAALAELTASIEAHDSADARHIRSNVHEQLGQMQLAEIDQIKWRELDQSYRSAYINERNDPIVLDVEPTDSSDADSGATGSSGSDQPVSQSLARQRANRDADGGLGTGRGESDVTNADATIAEGAGDSGGGGRSTPGASAGAPANSLGSGVASQRRPSSLTNPSESTRRERGSSTANPSAQSAANRSLTSRYATDTAPQGAEGRSSDEASGRPSTDLQGESAEEPREESETPDEEQPAPARPRLPGSTWQPLSEGVAGGAGAFSPRSTSAVPTTGITGPSGNSGLMGNSGPTTGITGPGYGGYGTESTGGYATPGPTTGIVGPMVGSVPESAGPAVPTTGIGASPRYGSAVMTAPVATSPVAGTPGATGPNPLAPNSLPSGIPQEFAPQSRGYLPGSFSLGPGLPAPGALSSGALPTGAAIPTGPAGNLPSANARSPFTGPNYSPLRPSPLTQPSGSRILAPGFVPSSTTSPIRQPTFNVPRN